MSRAAFLDFLNDSVMGSMFTALQDARLREPRLHADLHAAAAAQGLRPRLRDRARPRRAMPVAAAAQQAIQALIGYGYTDEDFAALLEQQASASGLELVSEQGVDEAVVRCQFPGRAEGAARAGQHGSAGEPGDRARTGRPALSNSWDKLPQRRARPPVKELCGSTCPSRSSATTEVQRSLRLDARAHRGGYDELLDFRSDSSPSGRRPRWRNERHLERRPADDACGAARTSPRSWWSWAASWPHPGPATLDQDARHRPRTYARG